LNSKIEQLGAIEIYLLIFACCKLPKVQCTARKIGFLFPAVLPSQMWLYLL